jgi:hypothetical protein
VVSGWIDAGTLAWLLAKDGVMLTKPSLLMIAWPFALRTNLTNPWPSAASGAFVGIVSP